MRSSTKGEERVRTNQKEFMKERKKERKRRKGFKRLDWKGGTNKYICNATVYIHLYPIYQLFFQMYRSVIHFQEYSIPFHLNAREDFLYIL